MSRQTMFAICLFVLSASSAQALIFSAPPRETPEQGKELYGPLVEHISKVTGVSVQYEHPGNWLNYQRNMRDGKYDIVFDGPHFISWRIEHTEHEAVARLPGNLRFFLVSDKMNEQVKSPDDLIGRNICGISPPNLSSLSVLDYYRNPVRQPVIKGINGGMGKVYKSFYDLKMCDAAVLRDSFYKNKLKDDDRNNVQILFTSKNMPNQGLSVSKRLSPEMKQKIRDSVTIGEGVGSTTPILKRFAGKAKSFIPTDNQEFLGYNMLLEGVIFGW